MIRIVAILLLCFIIVNLFWGLFSLLRDRSASTRTIKALTLRVGVSLVLFILIVLSAAFDIFPSS